jgi:hypothetical protein
VSPTVGVGVVGVVVVVVVSVEGDVGLVFTPYSHAALDTATHIKSPTLARTRRSETHIVGNYTR